jgi:hypothetical protein
MCKRVDAARDALINNKMSYNKDIRKIIDRFNKQDNE